MQATLEIRSAAPGRLTRPPLLRLTATELRKMVDTRAGIALLVVTELLAAAVVLIEILTRRPTPATFATLLTAALTPVGILLPVLGILSVTSEWSQRTALTTFSLVPRRERVVASKILAAVVLAVLAAAACMATAAAGNAFGIAVGRGNGSWHVTGMTIGGAVLATLISVLQGTAFGMLLRSSPLAIVLYFVLPTAWSVLGNVVSWLHRWDAWLDPGTTGAPLLRGGSMSAESWEKLAASAALWVLLPLLVGLARLLRSEFK